MATLQDISFRPACVVSALPKRFRESLTRELKGTVAISTCPVSELETAVQQRCATLAVVGVSGASLDVAERLSHNQNSVKVFLAHYNNTFDATAPKNGFAGVFDLRAESKRLADSIRQSISCNRHHPPISRPFKRLSINLVSKFTEIQERISNPTALMESILETFLQLTGSDEGLLLVPSDLQRGAFTISAARGQSTSELPYEVFLERRWLPSLQQGEACFTQEGLHLSLPSVFSTSAYYMGAPIMKDGHLCALFLGDSPNDSEILHQFLEGLTHIFRQLTKKQVQAEWDQFLKSARQFVCPGWILVDGHNRIVHHEGADFAEIAKDGFTGLRPRLRNLVHRALRGESGSESVQNKIIAYQPFQTGHRKYASLACVPQTSLQKLAASSFFNVEALNTLMQSSVASETGRSICTELIANLNTALEVQNIFDIKRLELLGITASTTSSEIPSQEVAKLGLVSLLARNLFQCSVTINYYAASGRWHFTVEKCEAEMASTILDLANTPIFQCVLKETRLSDTRIHQSQYGFQLVGDI